LLGYDAVAEAQNDDDDDDLGADDMAELKNTAEAADHLGLTPGYLTNLRCWGIGPRWRRICARNVGYDVADLDSWVAERQTKRLRPDGDGRS
jgi:hypothetical protein